jgi:hypothetical protein
MSKLTKAIDIANTLAAEQGWRGAYVIDDAPEDHDNDQLVYWHSPTDHARSCDCVAYITGDELIIPTEMEIAHEPLVHACDLVLGDAKPGDHSLSHDLQEVA